MSRQERRKRSLLRCLHDLAVFWPFYDFACKYRETGLSLTAPLVGGRRRFRRGLSEPGFETRLAESCVIAGNECPLTQLHAVVTRVRVSDNLARIIACG